MCSGKGVSEDHAYYLHSFDQQAAIQFPPALCVLHPSTHQHIIFHTVCRSPTRYRGGLKPIARDIETLHSFVIHTCVARPVALGTATLRKLVTPHRTCFPSKPLPPPMIDCACSLRCNVTSCTAASYAQLCICDTSSHALNEHHCITPHHTLRLTIAKIKVAVSGLLMKHLGLSKICTFTRICLAEIRRFTLLFIQF